MPARVAELLADRAHRWHRPRPAATKAQTLTFDGTSSSDPDGEQLSYQWSVNGQVAGIQPTLSLRVPAKR